MKYTIKRYQIKQFDIPEGSRWTILVEVGIVQPFWILWKREKLAWILADDRGHPRIVDKITRDGKLPGMNIFTSFSAAIVTFATFLAIKELPTEKNKIYVID